jgi:hypothetical protein
MRKWREMLINKKIICLTVGLLPLLVVLLIGTAVTAKKITASKQQVVSSTEEAQVTVPVGGESSVQVSRSTDADRYSVYILAQVIEGEAADEPYEGKVAVVLLS